MRTSSMSSGTTLLASRAPPQTPQQQQSIGSNTVNPGQNLLGQLPTNPTLLKAAAAGGQNAAKMFNANAAVNSILNHRNTPPNAMSTFQFHPQRPHPTNSQQRIGFQYDSPLINNESDFPSLNTRSSPAPHSNASNNLFGQPQFNLQSMSMYPTVATKDALRMPYANMMRGVDGSGYGQTTEFSLQSEDFPALPGASQQQQILQNSSGMVSNCALPGASQQQLMQNSLNAAMSNGGGGGSSASNQPNSSESQLVTSGQTSFNAKSNFYSAASTASSTDFFSNGAVENGKDPKLNILISVNNSIVSNIPPGMLCDQYGVVGLLTFMKSLEQYPGLSALSIGLDISKLGLNMSSSSNLYQNFGGPWAEQPCRVQDHEAKVPEEYLTNNVIRDKLPTIKVNKLSEDILFYLFYNCPGQVYQLAAASELYQRDWRYHKVDAVWLTRSVYGGMKEQTTEYETGSYNIFDPIQWRKVPKEMKLEYKLLEGKPVANPSINGPNLLNSNGNVVNPGQLATPFSGTQPPNMAHFSSKNI